MKELIVFLGPSLPLDQARKIVRADFRGPARQGDVWRALQSSPRAIAIIDGVFEAQPSVWHREILSALSEGVAVFGASSMGALRAAELAGFGMIGVGEIFSRYASGEWIDDSDVALLHADAEHGFRGMTVPLVNVKATAEAAVRARVLKRAEARRLVALAEELFYQERSWDAVVRALPEPRRESFLAWRKLHGVDLKARDASECLRIAEEFVRSGAEAPRLEIPLPGALARRRRLHGEEWIGRSGASVISALQMQRDAAELMRAGAAEVIAETVGSVLGADGAEWIGEAPWRFADGPDAEEALVTEARRVGRWDALAEPQSSSRKKRR